MKIVRRAALAAVSLSLAFAAPAMAQSDPIISGEYVEVTSVTVDDGHALDYANFLSSYWRAQQEFMKQQGWITSYEVLSNIHKRAGEPDLYLIQRAKSMPDAAEIDKRNAQMRAQMKMSDAQMEAASGDRAKYRHVLGSELLQELKFRN